MRSNIINRNWEKYLEESYRVTLESTKDYLPGETDKSNIRPTSIVVKTGTCIVPNAKHYTADLGKLY
jgi:hypothetical protein